MSQGDGRSVPHAARDLDRGLSATRWLLSRCGTAQVASRQSRVLGLARSSPISGWADCAHRCARRCWPGSYAADVARIGHALPDCRLYCLTTMVPDEDFAALIRAGVPDALDAEDRRVLAALRSSARAAGAASAGRSDRLQGDDSALLRRIAHAGAFGLAA